ncbi:hypothetical protein, partial [Acinetobacter baumannii]|uniref:hypothetical protein n=1 Tax=Acinetobacter baumannii TaxID=470 RepID=UPI00148CB85C
VVVGGWVGVGLGGGFVFVVVFWLVVLVGCWFVCCFLGVWGLVVVLFLFVVCFFVFSWLGVRLFVGVFWFCCLVFVHVY